MKIQFKNEITLGNTLQIFVMVGGVAAYFINVEHRMSVIEVTQKSDSGRIDRVEAVISNPRINTKAQ